jgi:hypothetical protein
MNQFDTMEMIKDRHHQSLYILILFTLFSGVFSSCQKVITLDLNSAAPQLVVEASISDLPGPYYVKLSRTVNFDNLYNIPGVEGAKVELSDSTGTKETLGELKNGYYLSSYIKGIPGHTYKLKIEVDGKTYEAVSRMPYPVTDLFVLVNPETDNRPFGNNGGEPVTRYQINYSIADPAAYKNYYRFVAYRYNNQLVSRRVFDDQYRNGKIISDEFGLGDSTTFKSGEIIVVELQNIDNETYNFFRTIREGAGSLTFLSASPSNPISNISNGGLGYFSAYSVTQRAVIIP